MGVKKNQLATVTAAQGFPVVPLLQGTTPTETSGQAKLYAKDVLGRSEVFAHDDDGNEIQITSAGVIMGGPVFVYKPSFTSSTFRNVYNDWTTLWNTILDTNGPVTIWFDESATIPPGTYSIESRMSLACQNSTTATILDFGDGVNSANDAHFMSSVSSTAINVFGSLTFRSKNIGTPVHTNTGGLWAFQNGAAITVASGCQPFYAALTAGNRDIYFNGRANAISASAAGDPAVVAQNGCNINIRLHGIKSTITPYALAFLDANPSTKITIREHVNCNGLISIAQPTAVAGQLNYPRFTPETFTWGANLNAPSPTSYMVANGSALAGTAFALDPITEHVCGTENQMRQFVWNSQSADSTTVFEVLIDGVVVFTTSAGEIYANRGAITMLPFGAGPVYATQVNSLGKRMAVRCSSGTAPGFTTVRIQ